MLNTVQSFDARMPDVTLEAIGTAPKVPVFNMFVVMVSLDSVGNTWLDSVVTLVSTVASWVCTALLLASKTVSGVKLLCEAAVSLNTVQSFDVRMPDVMLEAIGTAPKLLVLKKLKDAVGAVTELNVVRSLLAIPDSTVGLSTMLDQFDPALKRDQSLLLKIPSFDALANWRLLPVPSNVKMVDMFVC